MCDADEFFATLFRCARLGLIDYSEGTAALQIYDILHPGEQAAVLRGVISGETPSFMGKQKALLLVRLYEHALRQAGSIEPAEEYFVRCVKKLATEDQTEYLPSDELWRDKATHVEFLLSPDERRGAYWECAQG